MADIKVPLRLISPWRIENRISIADTIRIMSIHERANIFRRNYDEYDQLQEKEEVITDILNNL